MVRRYAPHNTHVQSWALQALSAARPPPLVAPVRDLVAAVLSRFRPFPLLAPPPPPPTSRPHPRHLLREHLAALSRWLCVDAPLDRPARNALLSLLPPLASPRLPHPPHRATCLICDAPVDDASPPAPRSQHQQQQQQQLHAPPPPPMPAPTSSQTTTTTTTTTTATVTTSTTTTTTTSVAPPNQTPSSASTAAPRPSVLACLPFRPAVLSLLRLFTATVFACCALFAAFLRLTVLAPLRRLTARAAARRSLQAHADRQHARLAAAITYPAWRRAAAALDYLHRPRAGAVLCPRCQALAEAAALPQPAPPSEHPQLEVLKTRLRELAPFFRRRDGSALASALRSSLVRNLAGSAQPDLFRHARVNPVPVVADFVTVVSFLVALLARADDESDSVDDDDDEYISDRGGGNDVEEEHREGQYDENDGDGDEDSDKENEDADEDEDDYDDFSSRYSGCERGGWSIDERLAYFNEARHAYGRTALMLSGGAAMGLHHLGVVKALLEQDLLPKVICGTSAGALVASIVGIFTDSQLRAIFETGDLVNPNTGRPFTFRYFDDDVIGRLRRFLRSGALQDVRQLQECLRENIGDLTFEEAYRRTKRILNITACPAHGADDPPLLLNYLTAPRVLIWSAASASCALPLVFAPVELMAKAANGGAANDRSGHGGNDNVGNAASSSGGTASRGSRDSRIGTSSSAGSSRNRNGEKDGTRDEDEDEEEKKKKKKKKKLVAYHPHGVRWIDGSMSSDVPLARIGELFNVSHFVVSQTNPHVIARSVPIMQTRVALLVKSELQFRYWQLLQMGLVPKVVAAIFPHFMQPYAGDVTIMPDVRVADLANLLSNPSLEAVWGYIRRGEGHTFQFLERVRLQCVVERALDAAVEHVAAAHAARTRRTRSRTRKRGRGRGSGRARRRRGRRGGDADGDGEGGEGSNVGQKQIGGNSSSSGSISSSSSATINNSSSGNTTRGGTAQTAARGRGCARVPSWLWLDGGGSGSGGGGVGGAARASGAGKAAGRRRDARGADARGSRDGGRDAGRGGEAQASWAELDDVLREVEAEAGLHTSPGGSN